MLSARLFLAVSSLLLSLSVFASSVATPPSGKYFDHVIIVLFENTNYTDALNQPFFGQLAKTGANFTDFIAEAHPSQPDYIALTSGSTEGVTSDSKVDLNVKNIADLLEDNGLTWKVYAENYPGKCYTGTSKGDYARKHNPFISYLNIQKNATRCANIIDATQFDVDAANGTLPNYIFYIPNMKNDGHDTDAVYADKWYGQKFSKYVSNKNFMTDTVLISTFDESETSSPLNQIYTTIVGSTISPVVVSQEITHLSLLKLIEDNWSLGDLGKDDVTAPSIPNIWQ